MKRPILSVIALLLSMAAPCAAQQDADSGKDTVSREDYEKLLKEVETLRAQHEESEKQLQALQKRVEATEKRDASGPSPQLEKQLELLGQHLKRAEAAANRSRLGAIKMVIAGDADVSFVKQRGANSTFSAEFGPLFLWQINDRLLLEAGVDLSLDNDPNGDNAATDVDLSLMDVTYLVNDYLAVGGGRFPTPFNIYHTHLDPSWINKLPTDPLPYGDSGIAPDSGLGVFANGAAPLGGMVVNYAVYVTNGPTLVTDDPDAAGSLSFDNFDDPNNNKAVGGRIGLLPVPGLEVGASVQGARVNPNGFEDVRVLLYGADLNLVRQFQRIRGRLTARAEWVWSRVEDATYDPTGALGFGPIRFSNHRNGGYVLVAYRPTMCGNPCLKKTEFVIRYDRLSVSPRAPGGGVHQRWTPGVDYWVTPSTVLKVAYEHDRMEGQAESNALLLQLGIGF